MDENVKLYAKGTNVLFEKTDPEVDVLKSKLLLSTSDLNPDLIHGRIINFGPSCKNMADVGGLIYGKKLNAVKISHISKEYYIIDEDDILVNVSEAWGKYEILFRRRNWIGIRPHRF